MGAQSASLHLIPVTATPAPQRVSLGKLVGIDSEGRPLVTFDGQAAPLVARVATNEPAPDLATLQSQPTVLLVFENDDARQPILTAIVRARFAPAAPESEVVLETDQNRNMQLNGKVLIFEAGNEIVLRCGRGSITLRADGQIVMKGTRLVSRASETNKIRGASVQIN